MKYILTFESEGVKRDDNKRFIEITDSINSKERLFDLFSSELSFPSYFGHNWDAFYDILSDLYWLDIHQIVVYHDSLPQLNEKDLRIYMGIIRDLLKHSDEDEKIVKFVFNTRDKEKIQSLLLG